MSEISRYVLMNVAAVLFIQTSFSLAALLNCSNNSTNESVALLFLHVPPPVRLQVEWLAWRCRWSSSCLSWLAASSTLSHSWPPPWPANGWQMLLEGRGFTRWGLCDVAVGAAQLRISELWSCTAESLFAIACCCTNTPSNALALRGSFWRLRRLTSGSTDTRSWSPKRSSITAAWRWTWWGPGGPTRRWLCSRRMAWL